MRSSVRVLFFITILFAGNALALQRERQIQPPEESQYGRRFFVQLRGVFGRFRETDLERAFDKAQPIQCSELVNDKGEWRTVAFFNEKRELGDWYRANFDEVKRDLSVFMFKGPCRGEHGPVQLSTKFPVTESVEAFNEDRIRLDEIEINVNAPIRASFDVPSNSYTFDLPYLFLVSRNDNERLYSLAPPRLTDRDRYATDVIDHWACKSVTAENVTYQFLICRTTTLPRNLAERNRGRASFGASAYFILSDGKEGSSNVRLSFGDADDKDRNILDESVKVPETTPLLDWATPDPDEKILDVARDEFRIRFNPETWAGRIGMAEVLSAGQMSSLDSFRASGGTDYCVWLSGGSNVLSDPEAYSVTAHDQDGQSSSSISFDMKSANDKHLGTLQCFFPHASSASSVAFSRWTAAIGRHLTFEVRP